MQRLLLDTHALLWWLTTPERLNVQTHEAISDLNNDVFVSAVSGWEIALKANLGKLQAPDNLAVMVERERFTPLAVTFSHGVQAGSLPLHHRDPFDRLLIAQAQAEALLLVTRDARIRQYGLQTMAA